MCRLARWRESREVSADAMSRLLGISNDELLELEAGAHADSAAVLALEIVFGENIYAKDVLTVAHAGEFEGAYMIRMDAGYARGGAKWQ